MTLFKSKKLAELPSHKEKLLGLYDLLHQNIYGVAGARVQKIPGNKDMLKVKLLLGHQDLKRYQSLSSSLTYLLDKANSQVIPLNTMPEEEGGGLLCNSVEPKDGRVSVRVRKGVKNEKDIFFEVWKEGHGFVSSLKVTEKVSAVYNDFNFGTVQWSSDGKKIVFVGEVPEVANFKPHFKDPEPKKEDKKEDKKNEEKKDEDKSEEKKKEEEKKEEHFQDEKFLYVENFGEQSDSKKLPGLFVFNLEENSLSQVQFGDKLPKTTYPTHPVFDETCEGIVFGGYENPIKKMGLAYCSNRRTNLYHLKKPVLKKEDAKELPEDYLTHLNKGEAFGLFPKFSSDFSKLAYVSSSETFITHSGNYQLKYLPWPVQAENSAVTSIDYAPAYPKDDAQFAGLFGYNMTYTSAKFLGTSNRFFFFQNEFKGQNRLFIADLETPGKVRYVNFLEHDPAARDGEFTLLSFSHGVAVVKHCSARQAPKVYAVVFKGAEEATSVDEISFETQLLHEITLEEDLEKCVSSVKKEFLTLDNGAEATFFRLGDEQLAESPNKNADGKHPMIVLIHGGPFSSSPQDMFLIQRNFFLMQGYCVLIINYSGTIGFGKSFMDSLLGEIGSLDVHDCGQLTKKAIAQFSDVVDPSRVCVEGGSHGGFLTGWLVGHPDYKDLWAGAALWNGVFDMAYMVTSTDIPDWIYACCKKEELDKFEEYNYADTRVFFEKSPISQIKNVKTPSLIIVGELDKRVPPHQSYFYYNCLKSKGVPTKLYNYPAGHGLQQSEEALNDAYINISLWLDEHANKSNRKE